MSRTKVHIEVSELQDAINQLEAVRMFSSPHQLYLAVAETPWAHAVGATWARVYSRIKEVNIDPDNPVITMRVTPARKVGPRVPRAPGEDRPVKTRRAKATGFTVDGFELLMEAFGNRGIEVTVVEQLITSSLNSLDENRAIMLAWADLRDKLGIPKPAKKAATPVSALADNGDLPITVPPVVVETSEDSVVVTEGPLVGSVDSGVVVTEHMPDGSLVETEVEPVGLEVDPLSAQVVIPKSIQVISAIRPVASRPVPIRSPMPPRPMPI